MHDTIILYINLLQLYDGLTFRQFQPDEARDDREESEDLEALFKIGSNYIHRESDQASENVKDSQREASVQVIDRKQKKTKKDKNKKDKKQKKEKKKQKKQKKKKDKQRERQHIVQKQKNLKTDNSVIARPLNYVSLQQYFTKKAENELQMKLKSNFAYNQKISDDLLSFSIIKFPEKGLVQYGLSIKDIPIYRRINQNIIVGLKSTRFTKEILQELNIKNNQRQRVHEDKNQDRYFHFKLQRSQGQRIPRIKQKSEADKLIIQFDHTKWAESTSLTTNLKSLQLDYSKLESNEAQLFRLNKEYSSQIGKNPQNIQIWIKFIEIQDTLSIMSGGNKNKMTLYERKLSIVEKALEKNPHQLRFKIISLNLLFDLKKGDFYTRICQKCWEYINDHPYSIQLWQIYLDYRFSQFSTFSNSLIRKEFEQITSFTRVKINEATSASLIWKIRKASLFVLSKILQIFKLEGYNQLSTGICWAMIEYNIFVPEKPSLMNNYTLRMQQFTKYWEDYENVYKVGEIEDYCSWQTYYNHNNQCLDGVTYLSHYQYLNQESYQDQIDKQLKSKWFQASWRPSHVKHDSTRIEHSPESFVLIEDISHLLQIYRDNQNLQILVDVVAQHLCFPPVFSQSQIDEQFGSKFIYKKLKYSIISNSFKNYSQSDKIDVWSKFPHLLQTHIFLDPTFPARTLYLKRLLRHLKRKLPTESHLAIDIYNMYIEMMIYLNPQLLQKLYDNSEKKCKQQISNILENNPSSIQLWICYIEGEYLKNNDSEQCFKVYKQLFQFENLSRKKVYKILYYMLMSVAKWKNEKVKIVLNFILQYLRQHHLQQFNPRQIKPIEILILYKLLLQRYKQFQYTSKTPLKLTKRHILSYFILFIISLFEPSEQLSSAALKIKQRLTIEAKDKMQKHSCLVLLRTKQGSLDLKDVVPCTLAQIELVVRNYDKPLFLIKYYLKNVCKNINLAVWMAAFLFFIKPDNIKLIQLFFLYGKQLVRNQSLSQRQINHTVRFAKLSTLLEIDDALLYFCIDHIPYGKELFLLLIKYGSMDKKKLREMIDQKQLRVVF